MTLKTATMIAMLAMVFAIGARFLLMMWSIIEVSRAAYRGPGFSFYATTVSHFAIDAAAYGALLLFLFVLWSKQQTPSP